MNTEYVNKFTNMHDEIYADGYDAGYNDGRSKVESKIADDILKSYNAGLDDAWECFKKITATPKKGGFSDLIMEKIFGYRFLSDILNNYSASEAVTKIKEYEKKKEADEESMYRDFEVGDIVEHTNSTDTFRAWITDITVTDKGNTYLSLMYEDGSTTKTLVGDIPWRKTGKKIDFDLKSVLDQIKGE